MLAVFYQMFDTVSDTDEAVVRMIAVPNTAVGDFLVKVLASVDIRGTLKCYDGALRLELHSKCILTTQTKIMQYFAHRATQLGPNKECTFRLPGAEWRAAKRDKLERQMTAKEVMFARTYGRQIPADRLERILDEAENYNYDKQDLTE